MGVGIWPSSRVEKEKEVKIQDVVLEVMNRGYEEDPNAIHSLICNRVPCNTKLAEDKTIVVDDISKLLYQEEPCPQVGLLGIINGILDEAGSDELLVGVFQDLPTNPPRRILTGFGLRKKEDFK